MPEPTTQDSDAATLREIAEHRSPEAFEALFSRYDRQAMGLAFHLTGDREIALDVVQEAMLAVWKGADRFDPERGSVSKWILRIVANTALKWRRDSRRDRQRMSANTRPVLGFEDRPGVGEPCLGELHQALSGVLGSLPEMERKLVALYYGAGLSQYEIASMLSLSQRTVSYKMTHLLDRLRTQLARSGFGALSAETIGAFLSNAVCGGFEVPAELWARVLATLRSSRQSRKDGTGLASGRPILVVLAVAVGAAWCLHGDPRQNGRFPADRERGAGAGAGAGAEPVLPGPLRASRFHKKWNFDTPAPKEVFKVVRGSWGHVPPQPSGASGYMLSADFLQFELRLPALRRPVVVVTRVGLPGGPGLPRNVSGKSVQRFILNLAPRERDTLEAGQLFNLCPTNNYAGPETFHWLTYRYVFSHDFEEGWIDGQRRTLCYRITRENAPLCFRLEGAHRIASIEVQELGEDELPNFDAYRAAIQAIPVAGRTGLVPLPGLKPLNPAQPVSVLFWDGSEERPD